MAAIDFSGIEDQLKGLGASLLNQLSNDLLKSVTDPEDLADAQWAATMLVTAPLAMIGADAATVADIQNEIDTAKSTLLNLASADVERLGLSKDQAWAKVMATANNVLSEAINIAFQAGRVALKVAIVA